MPLYKLTPEQIQKTVELAFVLEPILDKKDCTTRYVDLPGKPLTDFLVAAINVGEIFREYAQSILKGNTETYSHILEAMRCSNDLKSKKYINYGLLVFMFIAIRSRYLSDNLQDCIKNMKKVLLESSRVDVSNYLKSWNINLETSTQAYKSKTTQDNYGVFKKANNLYELFMTGSKVFNDPSTTTHQFCKEHIEGYPTIKEYIDDIDSHSSMLGSVEKTYNRIHQKSPQISEGLLSDLAATSIFVYLSYKDPKEYIIR